MSHPVVSIILPTYNRAGLLQEAVRSVLAQSYPHWELIIWDDGSSDSTRNVVQSFPDGRIIYYFEDNRGMSYALNQAVRQAAGEYLAFLDDDDRWTENKLSLQLAILQELPEAGLVFGNYQNINLAERKEGIGFEQNARGMRYLTKRKLASDSYLITDGFLQGIAAENFIAFDSVMARKNVIEHLGFFNENLRNGMDFEYWWRFGLSGGKPAYTDEIVLHRVKYFQSLSGRNLATYQNYLKTLDSCVALSLAANRRDVIPYLNHAYRNTWQNLTAYYGSTRDKKNILKSFCNSLIYGFKPGSLRIFLLAILASLSYTHINKSK